MNLLLKPELEKFIDEQVQQGLYDSAEDAINAAVAQFKTERELTASQLDRMRDEVLTVSGKASEEEQFAALKTKLERGAAEAERGELIEGTKVFDEIREMSAERETWGHYSVVA